MADFAPTLLVGWWPYQRDRIGQLEQDGRFMFLPPPFVLYIKSFLLFWESDHESVIVDSFISTPEWDSPKIKKNTSALTEFISSEEKT